MMDKVMTTCAWLGLATSFGVLCGVLFVVLR